MAFFAKNKKRANPTIDMARINQVTASKATSDLSAPVQIKTNQRAERKQTWCVCTVSARSMALREGVILNISDTGLRIRFSQRGALPPIVVAKAGRIGLHRRARVVWQDVFDAGFEFLD